MEQQNNSKVLVLSVLLAVVLTAVLVIGGMSYWQEKSMLDEESELTETEEQADSAESSQDTAVALVPNNSNNSSNSNTSKPVEETSKTPNPTPAPERTPESEPEAKKAPNVYTNARYRFSLELPPTWGEVSPVVVNPEAPAVDPSSPFKAVTPIQTITFQSPEDSARKFVIEIFATDGYPDGFASRTKLHQDGKYTISLNMSQRESDARTEVMGLIIPSFKKF